MFAKAQRNYYRELDVIQILKKVRDAESFRKLYLNQQQQMLLKFGVQNVISSSELSSAENRFKDPIDVLSKSVYSQKTNVALFSLGMVNKIL